MPYTSLPVQGLLLPPEVWLSEDALYSRNDLGVTQADSLVPQEFN
ncbi:hypothetical protein H1P_1190017 [Hyella patelloides LEGE 07179]|uniref:Uncharacterized protein n=1 Tax=Hyella patelloides LEGE 07179 TaxID=945734 RepID=A0A563VJW7_9CYAN|nr:hypothetical protein H1P_1190017 [Hyella patelloides LEGE 07179]